MQEDHIIGNLYLSGGGNDDQSFPLDNLFFNEISRNGRFLYIPIALRGHRLYPGAAEWMAGILKKHERDDVGFDVVDDLHIVTKGTLMAYDAVYVGGGNTWLLMQEMRQAGFDTILKEYIQSGRVVYGGSAGAIILGREIDTHDDVNDVGVKDFGGLNVLGGYSVACHFKKEQEERFRSWADTRQIPILCLPEDTGLVVKDGRMTCIGGNPCLVIPAQKPAQELAPGKSFE